MDSIANLLNKSEKHVKKGKAIDVTLQDFGSEIGGIQPLEPARFRLDAALFVVEGAQDKGKHSIVLHAQSGPSSALDGTG